MPENSEIIHAVMKGLDNLEIETVNDNWAKGWTKAVNTKLCEIGQRFGYKVYASHVEKGKSAGGEWLYDVTWLTYDRSGDSELMTDAPLVAECEWGGRPDIERDFRKLLLARAGVRVMIVDVGHRHDRSGEIANSFAKQIKEFEYSRADDAWLLAVVEQSANYEDWKFRYFTGFSLQEYKP